MKKALFSLLFVIFLDLLGFSLFIPLLPDFVRHLGGNDIVFGLVLAAFSLGQFIMAPVWGRLSDRWGRRPILIFSSLGSVLAWVGLALAPNLTWLFISRLFGGLMGANFTVAQSYIVDISPPEQRTQNLGLTGMAFGLGFVLGPSLGALIFPFGLQVAAWASAGFTVLALLMVIVTVKESLPEDARHRAQNPLRRFSFKLLGQALGNKNVLSLLLLGFLVNLGFSLFQTMFTPVTQKQLGWNPTLIGLTLAYVGILVGAFQGGGIGLLVKRFDEYALLWFGLALLGASLIGWAFTFSGWYLYLILLPNSLGAAVTLVLIRSLLTKAVPAEEVGGILGLATAFESLTRIIGPAVGGVLTELGAFWPGLISGLLVWLSLLVGYRLLAKKPTALSTEV